MNWRWVRGLTPLMAMRKRRPQPAMTRSGQEFASALMMASAISCAQWLVASVTGAGGNGHTIVPCLRDDLDGPERPRVLGRARIDEEGERHVTADMCWGTRN